MYSFRYMHIFCNTFSIFDFTLLCKQALKSKCQKLRYFKETSWKICLQKLCHWSAHIVLKRCINSYDSFKENPLILFKINIKT